MNTETNAGVAREIVATFGNHPVDAKAEEIDWDGLEKCITAALAEKDAEIARHRNALLKHGYRESCDIPACNCGDNWSHGGHAAERLREISDEVWENGVATLEAVRRLKQQLVKKDTEVERLRTLAEKNNANRDMLTHSKLRLELSTVLGWSGLPDRENNFAFTDAVATLKQRAEAAERRIQLAGGYHERTEREVAIETLVNKIQHPFNDAMKHLLALVDAGRNRVFEEVTKREAAERLAAELRAEVCGYASSAISVIDWLVGHCHHIPNALDGTSPGEILCRLRASSRRVLAKCQPASGSTTTKDI